MVRKVLYEQLPHEEPEEHELPVYVPPYTLLHLLLCVVLEQVDPLSGQEMLVVKLRVFVSVRVKVATLLTAYTCDDETELCGDCVFLTYTEVPVVSTPDWPASIGTDSVTAVTAAPPICPPLAHPLPPEIPVELNDATAWL